MKPLKFGLSLASYILTLVAAIKVFEIYSEGLSWWEAWGLIILLGSIFGGIFIGFNLLINKILE